MLTNKKALAIILTLLLTTAFSGCAKSPKNPVTEANTPKSATSEMKTFTVEELKKCNGQNGNPAYVAIDGKVYDVTNSKSWKNGNHKGVTAGNDLTEELKKSPHGASVLKKLPIVGSLVK